MTPRYLEDEVDAAAASGATPWTGIWMTALVSGAQALIFYGFFVWKRKQEAAQNHLDLYEPRQHTRAHRSPEAFAGSWWKEAWKYPDEALLRAVGLDTFQYLRVLWLGVRLCFVGTLLSLVLIPVYATGSIEEAQEFNQLTLARVDKHWRLYVAVVCWYIFSGFALALLWKEWTLFRINKSQFLATGDPDMPPSARYAAVVEQASEEQMMNLKQYLDELFPGAVLAVTPCLETADLEKLITEREQNILKLEAVLAKQNALPDKPPVMIKVKRKKVEAATHYTNEIERLNQAIDQLRSKIIDKSNSTISIKNIEPQQQDSSETEHMTEQDDIYRSQTAKADDSLEVDASDLLLKSEDIANNDNMDDSNDKLDRETAAPTTNSESNSNSRISATAFAAFKTLKAKQAAVQCEIAGDPDAIFLRSAADPNSIVWPNVTARIQQQTWRQFACGIFWCVGILFWAVPVSFITSIANLNGILEALKLKPANPNAAWYGLVSGLLPVIFLAILMAVLYMAIRAAAVHVVRLKSWPQVDAYTLYWHQLFQFANLWLILIGGSLFNQLDAIIEDKDIGAFVEVVAKAMPGASSFFVNMMLVSALGGLGMELSRLTVYAVQRIVSYIQSAPTQRQLDDAKKPPAIEWGKQVPPTVFIFLVVFMYSTIVPLMQVFGLLYFTGMYLVWKHQCLHVYAVETEGGGDATWNKVFGFLIACLYMAETIFIVYMGLKEAPVPAGLGFVPLIITVLVHRALKRKLIEPLQNLSLELAAEIDRRDGVLKPPENGGGDELYLQPALDAKADERGPLPYRPSDEAVHAEEKVQQV